MKGHKTQRGCIKNTPLDFANNNPTGKSCLLLQRYEYIPLDFIKARVIGISKEYFMNRFEFIPVMKKEGEIQSFYFIHENIKIVVFPNSEQVYFSGNLHKFYNRGLHNYNDFNLNAFERVLTRLFNELGIRPENLYLEQIEIGLNIIPPIRTDLVLNHLLEHGKREFERVMNSLRGTYSQIQRTEYFLKIYNKAKQYKQRTEIMRFEIKAKTRKFRSVNPKVTTLQDFIQAEKLDFVLLLLKEWDNVTMFDPTIETRSLSKREIKYRDIENWRGWFSLSGKTLHKHRSKTRSLNEKRGSNIQERIKELFIQKVNELQRVTISDFTQNERVCKLTGIDISMQREHSFLLSHKGLRHLKETNVKEFERMKKKFLPINWRNESEYNQIKEIAHRIRNAFNNRMKRTDPNQVLLNW
jgi:hypothetical protein